MNHRRIKWGLLGGGADSLIGIVHRVAAHTAARYELVGGVFSATGATGARFASDLQLDPSRSHASVEAMIEAENSLPEHERIQVVTVATPNYLHYDMAAMLIRGGFNVICEKPITTTVAEALDLAELLRARDSVFAVAHTYTGYPMVRQMREMISAGAIGAVHKVDAQYYQGWVNAVIHDEAKRGTVWRLDPASGGPSSCFGDIGVHAFNLIEYTTGLDVREALADLDTLYPSNPLDVDGNVLLRLANGAKGVLSASQVATGEANNLQIAVYGRAGGLKWAQENPGELQFLQEGKPLSILKPGYAFNLPAARDASKLPPGHPEGFIDAMANIYRGVARAILREPYERGAFPTILDGVRGMRFVTAVLQSAERGGTWVAI